MKDIPVKAIRNLVEIVTEARKGDPGLSATLTLDVDFARGNDVGVRSKVEADEEILKVLANLPLEAALELGFQLTRGRRGDAVLELRWETVDADS